MKFVEILKQAKEGDRFTFKGWKKDYPWQYLEIKRISRVVTPKMYCGFDWNNLDWSVDVRPDGSIKLANGAVKYICDLETRDDFVFCNVDTLTQLYMAIEDSGAGENDKERMKEYLRETNSLMLNMKIISDTSTNAYKAMMEVRNELGKIGENGGKS